MAKIEDTSPEAEETTPVDEPVETPDAAPAAEETVVEPVEAPEAAEAPEAPAAEEAAPEAPAAEEAAPAEAPAAVAPDAKAPVSKVSASEAPTAEAPVADAAPASEYSTETPAEEAPRAPRPVLSVPGAAVGRRKEAIARVRITPGPGTFSVNGRTLEEYFPNKLHQQLINDPFKVLDLLGSYDVIAKITGGGPSGQAGALRLAIARSLNEIDRENNRAALKKAGFLTRDARVIERKKAGLKKARKASQFSKR
jgi:small subunit ribosomal protein S9